MNDLKIPSPALAVPGYEEDLVAWMESQIELLRGRKFGQLDLENLLEELDGMVRHERRELRSRLELVMLHLLKHQFQSSRRRRSWLSTLHEQRREIAAVLEDSPSLRRLVDGYLEASYAHVAKRAALETGLARSDFPASCPYTLEQLLDDDFLP